MDLLICEQGFFEMAQKINFLFVINCIKRIHHLLL
jgi:hypothetical protein